ncbi:hypothetical protein [Nocardia terpenica]|uniref:Uncharacterized protein n=1 Tax=Nocardia terpenica TaxID=455432 RepID=A0A6G9Z6H9_9NOCA|nr:hypothetical protein [Nocardia terpenica]QIS20957.1 hypothetical protein F6W96_24205 [Nocardia terpenica]
MTLTLAVAVPADDPSSEEDLRELNSGIATEQIATDVRPFDGETMIQTVIGLSTVTYPYFRTWVLSRLEHRKVFKIVINGIEMSGYSDAEVQRILRK